LQRQSARARGGYRASAQRYQQRQRGARLGRKALEKPGAALRLDLPCGNFYFTSIQASLALTVHVHGRTAIYVAGDVSASSSLAFTLETRR